MQASHCSLGLQEMSWVCFRAVKSPSLAHPEHGRSKHTKVGELTSAPVKSGHARKRDELSESHISADGKWPGRCTAGSCQYPITERASPC